MLTVLRRSRRQISAQLSARNHVKLTCCFPQTHSPLVFTSTLNVLAVFPSNLGIFEIADGFHVLHQFRYLWRKHHHVFGTRREMTSSSLVASLLILVFRPSVRAYLARRVACCCLSSICRTWTPTRRRLARCSKRRGHERRCTIPIFCAMLGSRQWSSSVWTNSPSVS